MFPQKTIKFFLYLGLGLSIVTKKLTIKLLFNFNNFNSRLPASSQHHIKYFNSKRYILAWFRAFWAMMRQNRSEGLISVRTSEKKIKKVTRKWHFTYLPRSPSWTDCTRLGTNVPLVDVINCDKFCDNLFKGFKFYRRSKFQFFP